MTKEHKGIAFTSTWDVTEGGDSTVNAVNENFILKPPKRSLRVSLQIEGDTQEFSTQELTELFTSTIRGVESHLDEFITLRQERLLEEELHTNPPENIRFFPTSRP
jgi:hypothetical protein